MDAHLFVSLLIIDIVFFFFPFLRLSTLKCMPAVIHRFILHEQIHAEHSTRLKKGTSALNGLNMTWANAELGHVAPV